MEMARKQEMARKHEMAREQEKARKERSRKQAEEEKFLITCDICDKLNQVIVCLWDIDAKTRLYISVARRYLLVLTLCNQPTNSTPKASTSKVRKCRRQRSCVNLRHLLGYIFTTKYLCCKLCFPLFHFCPSLGGDLCDTCP